MNEFFVRLLDDVNSRIKSLNVNILSGSQIIQILCEALEQLRAYVRENGFVSMEEEIKFFKIFKPQLCSQFIYYFEVRSIQSRFPCYSSKEMVELFYRGEIKRIDRYFIDNLYLQQYMELGATYLDEYYFTRGKLFLTVQQNNELLCDLDSSFSTFFDSKVSRLMAYKKLLVYLHEELYKQNQAALELSPRKLRWNGSKRDLVAIIYSFYAKNCVDATLRELADWIEYSFAIDLGDFYHTYQEIKERKLDRTEFLDELKKALLKKMDEEEE